jgi:hypothetical protein
MAHFGPNHALGSSPKRGYKRTWVFQGFPVWPQEETASIGGIGAAVITDSPSRTKEQIVALRAPATNLRRPSLAPSWYVLEQIQPGI